MKSYKLESDRVLRNAQDAGFVVSLKPSDKTRLVINGPQNKSQIIKAIKANKDDILKALNSSEESMDQYIKHVKRLTKGMDWLVSSEESMDQYIKRLTKGMDWLVTAWGKKKWTPNLNKAFYRNWHGWHDLEQELRILFPDYQDCPVNGCKDPVSCQGCNEIGG